MATCSSHAETAEFTGSPDEIVAAIADWLEGGEFRSVDWTNDGRTVHGVPQAREDLEELIRRVYFPEGA